MATETWERPMAAIKVLASALVLVASAPAFASGGEKLPFSYKPDTANLASLQRGARDFMSYCSGCHSLKYLRYNRLGRDLDIPEDLLQAHLMFTSDKTGDHIVSSMPKASGDPAHPSVSEQWFGRSPPDLSLTARERGVDWIYSYLLTFYLDPSRPAGVNNLVLPGASMPHVLGDLQGWQVKLEAKEGEGEEGHGHHGPQLELAQPGGLSPAEYKERVGDITNFLVYAAEPGRNKRIATGVGVLLFTVIFGIFCYLLKVEYWKDVH
jgi:ubiquinol-cytochrome c reductase cytochrome c1 subunit